MIHNLFDEQRAWEKEQAERENRMFDAARAAVLALPEGSTLEEMANATMRVVLSPEFDTLLSVSPIQTYLTGKVAGKRGKP